ncbi:MAG: hypothetical protein J6M34_00780 [Clostridia bacterium]|nr:hypothetical protein [Clostridia bacterium]
MGKIREGRYEIHTSKAEAITRFRQLQGPCREERSDEKTIEFFCSKRGKIAITRAYRQRSESDSSTNLYGRIITQDGKTYVTYYTTFSGLSNFSKLFSLILGIIVTVFALFFAVKSEEPAAIVASLILGLALLMYFFINGMGDAKNAPGNSQILIEELERRVIAVNNWNR